jgi:DNA-binding response OmpR family regulator
MDSDYLQFSGGTKITRATDYEECVRLANSASYDLVIFFGQTTSPGGTYRDYPLTNSIRAIREIKAKVTTPIIALSTMPETEQQLLSAGADVFLAMPYLLKDFPDAVDWCLDDISTTELSDAGGQWCPN